MHKTFFRDNYHILRGAFLQALSDTEAEYIADGLAVVSASGPDRGKLLYFGEADLVAKELGLDPAEIVRSEGLFLPAFYDMHFHWVQDDVREMPKASLLEWLEKYTFPTEAKYADRAYAKEKAECFWSRILSLGTIGGLCYSSIHEVALEEALAVAPEDFRIGNVLMTMHCPDYIQQTDAEAIASVETCAERYGQRYVASPRFAPTTAPEVMAASAAAAERHGCFQQTHLSETEAEIDWVLGIYRERPEFDAVASYTHIYQQVGMLGPRSVFGHCIHLAAEEWQLLADSNSIIASCPTSNAPIGQLGIGSGLFDYQMADKYGVRWALASDIGGGPFLSMFDVMRSFVCQNRDAGHTDATYLQALYRSTRMSAVLLELGAQKGMFKAGYDFDAIRVPLGADMLATADAEVILESVVNSVRDRNDYDNIVLETIIKGESRFKSSKDV